MGKVERMNQQVMRHLRVLTIQHKANSEWSSCLPLVQHIINNALNRVTGLAPAQLLYGDAIDLSRQLLTLPPEEGRVVAFADYLEGLIHAQSNYARLALEAQQRHVAAYLEQLPANPTSFNVGDCVLVSYPNQAPSKLHPRWRGPMIVMSIAGNTYECQDVLTQETSEFDVSRLKLYKHDEAVAAEEAATWDDERFLVEDMLDHRGSPKSRTKMKFKVRWQGFGPESDTWEPYALVKTLEVFQRYKTVKKLKYSMRFIEKGTGLYATAVIKKKRFWPKGVPGSEIVAEMQGRPVGEQRVYKGASGSDNDGLWLGCMADSKHISIMCNSWSTTSEMGARKKRRVGTGLTTFKYGEYQHYYYMGRNAVDCHNQNRQGVLDLEASAAVKDWAKRQFFFILAAVVVNAMLATNYFVRDRSDRPHLSKAQHRRVLATRLVRNPFIEGDPGDAAAADPGADPVASNHELMKIPTGKGRFKDGRFPNIRSQYAKYRCAHCSRLVRTYCACGRTTIVCARCYHIHIE